MSVVAEVTAQSDKSAYIRGVSIRIPPHSRSVSSYFRFFSTDRTLFDSKLCGNRSLSSIRHSVFPPSSLGTLSFVGCACALPVQAQQRKQNSPFVRSFCLLLDLQTEFKVRRRSALPPEVPLIELDGSQAQLRRDDRNQAGASKETSS